MKRLMIGLFALALVAAACGDDDLGSTGDTVAPRVTTASATSSDGTSAPANDAVDAPNDSGATSGGIPTGTAIVEIGEYRYEFDLNIVCLTMFGAVGAEGSATDGSDVTISADFPPQDWEANPAEEWSPPSINVDDGPNNISWLAGGEVADQMYPGLTGVAFTSDGSRVFGTAVFINTYVIDDQTPVEGTFEVVC